MPSTLTDFSSHGQLYKNFRRRNPLGDCRYLTASIKDWQGYLQWLYGAHGTLHIRRRLWSWKSTVRWERFSQRCARGVERVENACGEVSRRELLRYLSLDWWRRTQKRPTVKVSKQSFCTNSIRSASDSWEVMKAWTSLGRYWDQPVPHRRIHEMVKGAWGWALHLSALRHRYIAVILGTRLAAKLRPGTLTKVRSPSAFY